MAVTLKYIATMAMDEYYRDFKGNTGFFELNDFIFHTGATIAEFYQKAYEQKYQELRQERTNKMELVGVDPDLLSVQTLTVDTKPGLQYAAEIKHPVMSFLYDQSSVGYQFLLPIEPSKVTLERGSMGEAWQYPYLPKTDRIFWWPQNGKIAFYQNSSCNVKEVDLYYIPSVMNCDGEVLGDAMIADGLMNMAVNATVAAMRELKPESVKMALDNNSNNVLQLEANPNAAK